MLQRYWASVLALVVVGGIIATGYSLLKTPQYQATAKAIITVESATSSSDLTQGSTYLQQVVSTYTDVATTPYVLNPVIKQLRLPDTASQLAARVATTNPTGETVLQVTATDPNPRGAAAISNAVIQHLATAVQDLAPGASNRTAAIRVSLLQSAVPPVRPVAPDIPLNIALGLVVGLILGVVVALARARTARSVDGPEDIERITDLPLIGSIAFRRSAESVPLVTDAARQFDRVEEFRALRSRVLHAVPRDRSATVLVTAAGSGQGTSTTAANLAISLADLGLNTVLVDANLQHGTLRDLFSIERTTGLSDVLSGRADLEQALVRGVHRRLALLGSGARAAGAEDLVASPRMTALLDELATRYQFVVLDAPPVLTDPETAQLAARVDDVLVVAAIGVADRNRLRRALSDLDDAGAWVLGVVATSTRARALRPIRRISTPRRSAEAPDESPTRSTPTRVP